MTRTAGGPGEGFSYREESNFVSTSSSGTGTTSASTKATRRILGCRTLSPSTLIGN